MNRLTTRFGSWLHRHAALAVLCWALSCLCCQHSINAQDDAQLQFFENRIRPVLIAHCLDCHATDTEASGGLVLDSRSGWSVGGDSGASIVAGDPAGSRLWQAISYDDPALQMPPEGKLPDDVIRDFELWIQRGAVDPRRGEVQVKQMGLPVEQAQDHWAYRPLQRPPVPQHPDSPTEIDAFINARLAQEGLPAYPQAAAAVQTRRLVFDLTGLPPTIEQLKTAAASPDRESDYVQLVDQLLTSPRFGEHFARKWMDVARYAESITLRGFILPQAWRYRDYLIAAYNQDRPFDQMIHEQLAGDLMATGDTAERANQLIATGLLAMGNTNLEQQDKDQLEMDYIDEQLELVGRAFLGQTIGCARCHDHKFDPIPTRDYYALAGVFHSAVAMRHDNVSKWIEQPLPLQAAEETRYSQLEDGVTELDTRIKQLNRRLATLTKSHQKSVPLDSQPGLVLDDTSATRVGSWTESTSQPPYLEAGYIHDGFESQGDKTVTFEPANLPEGEYDVRISYSASGNRASNVRVHVFSADGERIVRVNQRQPPEIENLWQSLGRYRFEAGGQAYVLISNAKANGHVIVDAVQFLPITQQSLDQTADKSQDSSRDDAIDAARLAELKQQLKSMETSRAAMQRQLKQRPQYLTIVEERPPEDLPIHVRGDVHNLGEVVPRGFLTALDTQARAEPTAVDRLGFAHWLTDRQNPLTARVYANRVWSWLMGRGLVATPNNFGTTGRAPSHPELLDWLACELIDNRWSTKHLVRLIVHSEAYRRAAVSGGGNRPNLPRSEIAAADPDNALYGRGHSRRLSAEALRDSLLCVSGELDRQMGGSLLRADASADYNYQHRSTRRSVYQPVLRNSLPDLFEAFDFADTSVSVGQRPRSTVATQALVLMNHPWVVDRVQAATERVLRSLQLPLDEETAQAIVERLYWQALGRAPSADELQLCVQYLDASPENDSPLEQRLEQLIHSLFASLDFRYLD